MNMNDIFKVVCKGNRYFEFHLMSWSVLQDSQRVLNVLSSKSTICTDKSWNGLLCDTTECRYHHLHKIKNKNSVR